MLLVPAAAINAAETAAIGQSLRISAHPARVPHTGDCSHCHRMFRQVVQELFHRLLHGGDAEALIPVYQKSAWPLDL